MKNVNLYIEYELFDRIKGIYENRLIDVLGEEFILKKIAKEIKPIKNERPKKKNSKENN